MATRQTSGFTGRYGGKEKTGYAVEHQDEEINHIQNDDPGIALEPGESKVVDVRCTLVPTRGQGGPDQVWTSRSPQDISVRTSIGE